MQMIHWFLVRKSEGSYTAIHRIIQIRLSHRNGIFNLKRTIPYTGIMPVLPIWQYQWLGSSGNRWCVFKQHLFYCLTLKSWKSWRSHVTLRTWNTWRATNSLDTQRECQFGIIQEMNGKSLKQLIIEKLGQPLNILQSVFVDQCCLVFLGIMQNECQNLCVCLSEATESLYFIQTVPSACPPTW